MAKQAKQLEMSGLSGWGGKRRGAGRPNLSGRNAHVARETVNFKKPLNITLKLREDLPNIRSKSVLKMFYACCARTKRFGLHVIHFSIQSTHIHMIVEAKDNEALARGMQSLVSSFAKALKTIIANWKGVTVKAGAIFAERYHLVKITCPTQMRRALTYVILNTSKHEGLIEYYDDYCSGSVFSEWKALLQGGFNDIMRMLARNPRQAPEKFGLSRPRTWLAVEGWKKARVA